MAPVSFNRYVILLGIVTGLLYLTFGSLSYVEYREARSELQAWERESARAELANTLSKAMDDLRGAVQELAQWDEVYQQLKAPTYFVYWYSHRISASRRLDERFSDLMVYDAQGHALSELDISHLPYRLDPQRLEERFEFHDGDVRVTFFRPLQRAGSERIQGYLGVQALLRPAVLRLYAFNQIDAGSLVFRATAPLSGIQSVLEAADYRLRKTRYATLVDKLVQEVVLTLGGLVLLPSLLLLAFFVRFVGRAVQRVPMVVSALRDAEIREPAALRQMLDRHRPRMRIAELETAEQSLLAYHVELSSANTTLDQKNQELWAMAHHDALTGTKNRRAFDDYWTTLQSLAGRCRQTRRLMLCDVNHFKAINDSYGHQTGDAVLAAVAECLHRALRRQEVLFRLGGDEFVCVLLDCDDEQAIAVGQRCENEVRGYPFASQLGIAEPVRLSIGISDATDDRGFPVKELLRQADIAMYASKRPASQSVTLYEPGLDGDTAGIFSSSANEAVFRAVESGEGLLMHYQPVKDVANRAVSYYEALLRLEHDGRIIGPREIFPVVESRHLEIDLDRAVVAQILRDLGSGLIPEDTGVAINLSASSVLNERTLEWLSPLREFTSQYKVVIELTETTLITQMKKASWNLAAMRNMGLRVALDDFGSGYSSLRYLTSMPVDIVKFDISLVHALGEPAQRRLVKHLVELISETGQRMVAEGIETEAMLAQAQEVGFTYIQGWLPGRPAPLRGIPALQADSA